MPRDHLLLRFRNLVEDVDTIEEHNKIAEGGGEGRVLWGWWKKPPEPYPDRGLVPLQRKLSQEGHARAYFVDSASSDVYSAQLYQVYYTPSGEERRAPDPGLCPEYYRERQLPAWFKVGVIREEGPVSEVLAGFVFSESNQWVERRSSAGLFKQNVGQCVADVDFLNSHTSLWLMVKTEDVGLSSRSDMVRPLDGAEWEAGGGYIVHLTDIHVGPEYAFAPPLADGDMQDELLSEAVREDLCKVGVADTDVFGLVVSGDLTWSGEPHQFSNAREVVERLANYLALHPSQVMLVPGNHDVEWLEDDAIDTNAELNYRQFCRAYYQADASDELMRIANIRIPSGLCRIVGLNSCRLESRENAGLGFVGRQQLRRLYSFFKGRKKKESERRIAALHHHLLPVNYVEDFPTRDKHTSLLLDAEGVIRALISLDFDLVLHGHQHQPYIASIKRWIPDHVDPSYPEREKLLGGLFVAGGGSIGARRGHLNTVGRNCYNLIEVKDAGIRVLTRIQSSSGPGFTWYQKETL